MVLAPYYRSYELPWEEDHDSLRRFRRLMWGGLALLLVFAIVMPFIPRPRPAQVVPEVSDRLVRLMVQEKPKPPPPPPVVKPVEEEKPREQPKPVPQEQRVEQARQKAEKRLANVSKALASLQNEFVNVPADTHALTTGAATVESRSDRSLIASKAGTSSAGVTSASSSKGFGGGAGALGTHSTGAVNSSVAAIAGGDKAAASSGNGKRGQEAFEEEFDRNKGALYALYTRALREHPELQGKLVLEVTVAPTGEVTACRVVSSELKDEELEHKIVARVKLIHFPAGNFVSTTFTKPIEFFPG